MSSFGTWFRYNKYNTYSVLCSLILMISNVSAACAQSDPIKAAAKQYKNDVEIAKKKLVDNLKVLETKIRASQVVPELKRQQLDHVTSAQQAFSDSGELPYSDMLVPLSFEFLTTVYKKRLPVAKLYQQSLDKALRANDTKSYETLLEWRKELDSTIIEDVQPLTTNRWSGTRYNPRASRPVNFFFKEQESGITSARMVINPKLTDSVIIDLLGKLDSPYIILKSTKVIKGPNIRRPITIEGFVIGKRLIMRINDPNYKASNANGWIVISQ